MPVTQTDIDALNQALAQGERVVRFADGRAVEYRSVSEIILARDDLQRQLAASQPRRRRAYLAQSGRGY